LYIIDKLTGPYNFFEHKIVL